MRQTNLIAGALSAVLVLSLSACGDNSDVKGKPASTDLPELSAETEVTAIPGVEENLEPVEDGTVIYSDGDVTLTVSNVDEEIPGYDENEIASAAATPEPGVHTSGEGSDANLESLADKLCNSDPDGRANIWYVTGMTELEWMPSADGDWSGSVSLRHIEDEYYSSAAEIYATQYSMMEYSYDDSDLKLGGKNSTEYLFLSNAGGPYTLDYASYVDNVFVSASVYGYSDDESGAVEYLNELLTEVGFAPVEY